MPRGIERALIVDNSPSLVDALRDVVGHVAEDVRVAGSVDEVRQRTSDWVPDLMLLDFALPDGTGLDVLAYTSQLATAPVVVAISGEAAPTDTFRLAQLGVRAFLRKPFQLEDVEAAIREALDTPPNLVPQLRGAVGHVAVKDMEGIVRETMVDEALAQADGSRRGAAKLLRISRQLLQHILRGRLP